MLKIKAFGYPSVSLNDQILSDFVSNKSLEVLIYIAINKEVHSREKLVGLFWGEIPDTKAKSSLRSVLHNLRKLVGDYVSSSRQTVEFNQDLPCEIGVNIFEDFYVGYCAYCYQNVQ
ncbi:MAG: hypothetical protein AAGD96_12630 [Chloroflexota bacterium]